MELLIEHRTWLGRGDFTNRFVDVVDGMDGVAMAFVEWTEAVKALDAGDLPCSSREGQILRLAASIAEGVPVNLGEAVGALDAANAARAAQAVLRASGHKLVRVTPTGTSPPRADHP